MTNTTVTIRRHPDAVRAIVPDGTPATPAAGPGAMVLEVIGGLLTWNVPAAPELPVAIIDDVDAAQEWVWALYGEPVAVALDTVRPRVLELERDLAEFEPAATGDRLTEAAAVPGLPALVVSARRLAYAHWASRWWPASIIDGIAALDPALLERDIALLTDQCESLVDGADAIAPRIRATVESSSRAVDYALAAGDTDGSGGALVLARGTGGWDWRYCPPGLVDASETAVSWELVRAAGTTTVAVAVAAHPRVPAEIPGHLRPWVRIDTGRGELTTGLRPGGDTWIGESTLPAWASDVRIALYVPGFGPDSEADPRVTGQVALRERIREFAAARLRTASTPTGDDEPFAPLLAEIDASAADPDF